MRSRILHGHLFLAVAAVLMFGCHKPEDRFLIDIPLNLSTKDNEETKITFVLPKDAYICSLVFAPSRDVSTMTPETFALKIRCSFPDEKIDSISWSREIAVSPDELVALQEDYKNNVLFSRRQSEDVLPHPWTNLSVLQEEESRIQWRLPPLLIISEDSTVGIISVKVDGDPAIVKEGKWYFRLQKFLDAV